MRLSGYDTSRICRYMAAEFGYIYVGLGFDIPGRLFGIGVNTLEAFQASHFNLRTLLAI